ncbi:anti-sigma factor [Rhizobium sp. BK376]|uniref:anti-sigma factor family protein n=1 Tax=Rhizobium sp. BK376 TaxID=2512149 RepID=UPI00104F1C3A|nr:anti-sigma factor [Rhizobium sp. BK376]TCR81456.1 anti-sigma factor RsiW [Rhizobium sp. BK376]
MSVRPITEDDLQAFVDGALDDARKAEIATYIEAHPDVSARVKSYADQRLNLRAIFDPIVDEPVPTHLNLAHMIAGRRSRRLPAWGMAAAATVLLVAGGSGGWFMRGAYQPAGQGMGMLAHEASNSYSVYASDQMRPVELRADDMPELVDWATQRLGHKPVLPDLSKSGYRLMGGRILSTSAGAGLMLMYDNDRGTRLVMLTRPMVADQNMPMTVNSEGNMPGWTWAADGMGYSLVGPMPAETLHPLADDIKQQMRTAT